MATLTRTSQRLRYGRTTTARSTSRRWSTVPNRWRPACSGRIDDASPRLREQLLEAMTRRYYRVGRLEGVEHREAGGVRFATTSFEHGGRRYRVAAAFAATEELEPTLRALGDMAGTLSEDERLLADVYAWRTDSPADPDALSGARRAAGGGQPRR